MDDPTGELIDSNASAYVTEETRKGPPLAYVAEKARTALEELHGLCRRLLALERGSQREVRDGAASSTWPLDELLSLAAQAFRHALVSYLALNNMLARELLQRQEAWQLVSFEEEAVAPQGVTRWLAQAA